MNMEKEISKKTSSDPLQILIKISKITNLIRLNIQTKVNIKMEIDATKKNRS